MAFDLSKLFEDNSSISLGSIGGKIKRIRELRGFTQKELGLRCGFTASTADVRIAQYERNKKIPREDALKKIAAALGVDECALFDANLLVENRMYHALFDIEDFHGLHPVRVNGRYYLEFSGPTIYGTEVHYLDYEHFLEKWAEQYEKYAPSSADSKDENKNKNEKYSLWRYEYPLNEAVNASEQLHDMMKMNRLQIEMDELNARMKSESEFARHDKAIKIPLSDAKKTYTNITTISEFILQIKRMREASVNLDIYSPEEKFDKEYYHILSFKTEPLLSDKDKLKLYAIYLCMIDTIKDKGHDIQRFITSKNNELYITYKIPEKDCLLFEGLSQSWDDMTFIVERKGNWPDFQLNEYENKFLKKIKNNDKKI